jgi:hypothetical protein
LEQVYSRICNDLDDRYFDIFVYGNFITRLFIDRYGKNGKSIDFYVMDKNLVYKREYRFPREKERTSFLGHFDSSKFDFISNLAAEFCIDFEVVKFE